MWRDKESQPRPQRENLVHLQGDFKISQKYKRGVFQNIFKLSHDLQFNANHEKSSNLRLKLFLITLRDQPRPILSLNPSN